MIIFKVCARLRRLTTPPHVSDFMGFMLTLLQDILTDDEIISDSYDLKEIDGVAYEADCKKISVGGESFGAYSAPRNHGRAPSDGIQTLALTRPPRRPMRAPKIRPSRSSMPSTPSA
jgi:hypothetical protein